MQIGCVVVRSPCFSKVPLCQSFPNVPRAILAVTVSTCALLPLPEQGTLRSVIILHGSENFRILGHCLAFRQLLVVIIRIYPSRLCSKTPQIPFLNNMIKCKSPAFKAGRIIVYLDVDVLKAEVWVPWPCASLGRAS